MHYDENRLYSLAQKLVETKSVFGFLPHPWIPNAFFVGIQAKSGSETKVNYTYIRKSKSQELNHRCECSSYQYVSICEHVFASIWTLIDYKIVNNKESPYVAFEDKYTLGRDFPQLLSKGLGKTTFKPNKEQNALFLRMLIDLNFRSEKINSIVEEASISGWKKTIRDLTQSKELLEKAKKTPASKKNSYEHAGKAALFYCLSPVEQESSENFHLTVQLMTRRYLHDGQLGELSFFPLNHYYQPLKLSQLLLQVASPEDQKILKTAFRSAIQMQSYSHRLGLQEDFDLESFFEVFREVLNLDRFLFHPLPVSPYGKNEQLQKLQKIKTISTKEVHLSLVAKLGIENSEELVIEPQLKGETLPIPVWPKNNLYSNFCIIEDDFYPIALEGREELMNYFMNDKNQKFHIPISDFSEFYAYYLNHLNWPDLEVPPSFQPEEITIEPSGTVMMTSHSSGKYFQFSVEFRYGTVETDAMNEKSRIYDPQVSKIIRRNYEVEKQLTEKIEKILEKYADQERSERVIPTKALPFVVTEFFENKIDIQIENKKIRNSESRAEFQASGIDWLDLKLEMNVEGVGLIPPGIILNALRKRENFIRLSNGDQAMMPLEWIKKYSSFAANTDEKDESIGLSKVQSLLLASDLTDNSQMDADKKIETLQKLLQQLSLLKKVKPSKRFKGTLRDYQQVGLGWIQQLFSQDLGGILADDMGLGKTVQVLSAIDLCLKDVGPVLIVAPKSLIFNWENETSKFTPHLKVLNITGNQRTEKITLIAENEIILTTYQTLRADIEKLKDISFSALILDEAQSFKNRQSQVFGACRLVKASKKLALTGTPIENSVDDLFSILDVVIPGLVTSSMRKSFLNEAKPEELQNLGKALKPFILRRTKKDVLTDLPEKTEKVLYCEMSPAAMDQYNKLKDFYWHKLKEKIEKEGMAKARFEILEAMLRLRQLACHPGLISDTEKKNSSDKLDLLIEELTQVIQGGHKVLVFSQFTSLLALLTPQLDQLKIQYEYLDGSTVNRQERVQRFQNDPQISVFVLSLKAGGVGLNLTAADYVFLLDPWWNPAAESQAIDRTHRIGQTKKVIAYKLVAKGTIEERIIQLQEKKKDLVEAIMNSEGQLKKMNLGDLKLLLS